MLLSNGLVLAIVFCSNYAVFSGVRWVVQDVLAVLSSGCADFSSSSCRCLTFFF